MKTEANIAQLLEARARDTGDDICFTDAGAGYAEVTYKLLRRRAIKLAYTLDAQACGRGAIVAADMGNCASHVYLLVAAAYAGFALLELNARLTEEEKVERIQEVARLHGSHAVLRLTEDDAVALLRAPVEGNASAQVNWARHEAAAHDEQAAAVIMFTSGTQGHPKAAALSWANLQGAARASNQALAAMSRAAEGGAAAEAAGTPDADARAAWDSVHGTLSDGASPVHWQLALPLYHVGGLAIVMRCLTSRARFTLYPAFDAATLLHDARASHATHVSVVDKMLQDMLRVPGAPDLLPTYDCILLGGAAPNDRTLEDAAAFGARVAVSYGMTETASHLCWAPAAAREAGMELLPGYAAVVVQPDEHGFGQLAVRGPGVFRGYLGQRARFTGDGFFITGDRGRVHDGRIVVAERTGDMFVSGGENVYPEEIRAKLVAVPDVTDAFVFGAEDDTWGRRPVAFVEQADAAARPGFNPQEAADRVATSLQARLARIYQPKHLFVLPELPRRGIGKVNRVALQMRYNERIDIRRVELWRVAQPFVGGMRTAKATLRTRETLLVRVTDWAGRTGIGEDAAFTTPWYLPETLDGGQRVLQRTLAPAVLSHTFLHPREVSALFARDPHAVAHPMACAAIESACWDLYGKIMGRSLRALIGGRLEVSEAGAQQQVPLGCVPGGAVVGLASVHDTLEACAATEAAGCTRVKLKIKPGHDVKVAAAVRKAFPQMTIVLDANQSYTEDDLGALRMLDALNIACLEEPLDPKRPPRVGPQTLHARLARLQRDLRTPIALDESWTTANGLEQTLAHHPDLRCVVMKIGKFGGVGPALDFANGARARGVSFWMGGMFETGVGKRLHAVFGTLPGCVLPGDIGDTARYFATDVCDPPFALDGGVLLLNPPGHDAGLGCDLDDEAVARIATWSASFEA